MASDFVDVMTDLGATKGPRERIGAFVGFAGERLARVRSDTKMHVETALGGDRAVEDGRGSEPSARPLVVLLQGPVGPFFARLARRLRSNGMRTEHVVFNAADLAFADHTFSEHGRVRPFWGRGTSWEKWLADRFAIDRPEAVVLFGCDRERHMIARSICARLGIPVLSLEEGYLRPGFVTAEWGGNNRSSPLIDRTDAELRALAAQPMPQRTEEHAFSKMSWLAAWYFIIRSLGRWLFPFSQHHRHRPIAREAFLWSRNAFRKIARFHDNRQRIDTLLETRANEYFVVPLQVRDDMQLQSAGRGWSNEALIARVMESFARHGQAHHLLVFKVHPLERGHTNYHELVSDLANDLGLEERAICIDDGSLGALAASCAGMVTINSTSGLSAVFRCKPLAVMGEAVFRRDSICATVNETADLDAFWIDPKTPDPEACANLLAAIRASALLPGSFYQRASSKVAATRIADKVGERLGRESRQWRACDGSRSPIEAPGARELL